MTTEHWVFLRGLVREQRHWEDFPHRFNEVFPSARVHLVDLPGNGDLYYRRSPLTVSAMVDAVRAELTTRNINGPISVLAISLGGMVAIDWMKRFPSEIQQAVIINTSLRGMGSFAERLIPENYWEIFKRITLNPTPLAREKTILAISSNLYRHKEALAYKWVSYAKERPVSEKNAIRQLLAATRYKAPKSCPHDRVLLLASKQDRLVSVRCSEKLAQAWQWPLRIHPIAGHDLPLDDSNWILQQISQWKCLREETGNE